MIYGLQTEFLTFTSQINKAFRPCMRTNIIITGYDTRGMCACVRVCVSMSFKNFNRKLPDTLKLRVSKKTKEKRQTSSSAAPTIAVETPQPVPEPVSVELSEYEQKGKFISGS